MDHLDVWASRVFYGRRNQCIPVAKFAVDTACWSARPSLRQTGSSAGFDSAFCAHGNCSLENQHGSFLTVEVRCDHSFRESVSSQFRLVVDILPVASNRLALQRPSSFGPPFLLTTLAFARISTDAVWFMTPYLAWVSFASVLNEECWRVNC